MVAGSFVYCVLGEKCHLTCACGWEPATVYLQWFVYWGLKTRPTNTAGNVSLSRNELVDKLLHDSSSAIRVLLYRLVVEPYPLLFLNIFTCFDIVLCIPGPTFSCIIKLGMSSATFTHQKKTQLICPLQSDLITLSASIFGMFLCWLLWHAPIFTLSLS